MAPSGSVEDLDVKGLGAPIPNFGIATAHLTYVFARGFAAWCFGELGVFDEAIANAEEQQRTAASLGIIYARGAADQQLGFVYLRKGELECALPLLERCIRTAREGDLPLLLMQGAPRLGCAYNLLGRIAESIALLEDAKNVVDTTRNLAWAPLTYAYLGEAYALAGRIEEGIVALQIALSLAREHDERSYEAWTLYLIGGVHALRNPPEAQASEDALQQSLSLARELQMRPLEAQCHLALGRLARRAGQDPLARTELTTATSMFGDMDMQSWLQKAEATLEAI